MAGHSDRTPMKKKLLFSVAAGLLAVLTTGRTAVASRTFVSNYENVLGTSMELKLTAPSQAVANGAEAAVLAEIARQSRILSAWDRNSEFTRWTASHNQPVHVSRELFEVLDLFDHWRVRTGGAL